MLDEKILKALADQAIMLGMLRSYLIERAGFTRAEACDMAKGVLLLAFEGKGARKGKVSTALDEMIARMEKENREGGDG